MKRIAFVIFAVFFSSAIFAGQCDYSYQQDRSGNSCGERSKYNDYGTQRRLRPYNAVN